MSETELKIREFDYGLKTQTEIDALQSIARSILKIGSRSAYEMGGKLVKAKSKLDHGMWTDWLNHHFAWSNNTAQKMMRIYNRLAPLEESHTLCQSTTESALTLLTAKSAPDGALDQAIELASQGHFIREELAKQLIELHTPPRMATCVKCEVELEESEFGGNVLCPKCQQAYEKEQQQKNPNGDPMAPSVAIVAFAEDEPEEENPDEAEQTTDITKTRVAGFNESSTRGSREASPFAPLRVIWEHIRKLSPPLLARFHTEYAEEYDPLSSSNVDEVFSVEEVVECFLHRWTIADRRKFLKHLRLTQQEEKSGKKFATPTLEDVQEYAAEKQLSHLEPEEFIDFYESKGWVVGKVPMRDWRAAARRWNRENGKKNGNALTL